MKRALLACILLIVATGCIGGNSASIATETSTAESTTSLTTAPTATPATSSARPSTSTTSAADPTGPATVNATDVTVEPGGSASVLVRATNASELHVGATDQSAVALDYQNATFSQPPSYVAASRPPYWIWESPQQSVTVRIPVRAQDAATGTYPFDVTAWNTTDHGHAHGGSDRFSVHVQNETA